MTRATAEITLSVCVDCLTLDANGIEDLDAETVQRCTEGFARAEVDGWEYSNDCPENCEGGFSCSPCDICKSPLGGDRHPAVLLRFA